MQHETFISKQHGTSAIPPADLETLQAAFFSQVKSLHVDLCAQGMDSNEAAAAALKIAAGVAKMPTFLRDVQQKITEARAMQKHAQHLFSEQQARLSDPKHTPDHEEGGAFRQAHQASQRAQQALGHAAHSVFLFFSSPESLHVAFWLPSAQNVQSTAATLSLALKTEESGGSPEGQVDDIGRGHDRGSSNAAPAAPPGTMKDSGAGPASSDSAAAADGRPIVCAEPGDISSKVSSSKEDNKEHAQSDASMMSRQGSLINSGEAAGSGRDAASAIRAARAVEQQQQHQVCTGAPASPLAAAAAAAAPVSTPCSVSSGLEEETWQLQRLDLQAVREVYKDILSGGESLLLAALKRGAEQLLETLGGASSPAASVPGLLRQLSIALACPLLEDMDHASLVEGICSLLVGLGGAMQQRIVTVLAGYNKEERQRLVVILQQYITLTLYQQQAITRGVEEATRVLGVVNRANDASLAPLPFSEFYNDAVNNEDFNIKEDFRRWKAPFQRDFSFCTCPYVYDPSSKARVLQMENQMAQFNELQGALFRGLLSGSDPMDMCPFLVLKVRRGAHLVQDTLIQINRAKEQEALRKPLKVKFLGEEGIDEGGVQKEFFQLLVRELFNPDYGMFTYDERTHLNWFRPSDMELDLEFELVGILIGLAIYNSHILEFQFPQVLYKRLMGHVPVMVDLAELHPDVHASMSKMLEYDSDTIDALSLTFQVDMEIGFGELASVDLVPGGSEIPVTIANRNEYVVAYTRHLLETSIDRQFTHFRSGFLRLCSGTALSWFRPEELEMLVCGGRELDLEALEGATLYDDGYNSGCEVVTWFWEVAHSLDEGRKKRLLFFVTGSDRVPIKGLAHLNPPFVISRMGGDEDRLPTAHTCFNHLLLPQYSGKEILRMRLKCALDNAEGFGLM
ncbi:hypothetical protein CEUSTIGMA_g869.t1 [Chlamydomonas eustigma]|uniref:HECT-type E3 ubiquitin transferase n=1 Tax=Chlamydomonas eustigma TaxID=1157962 RepID=A0A250WRE5_9CHLO|nr:hypothetical protein CEUSTIGMA_g869.t1 [Chlamydomonas eustigma]|eukprot:GAX73417.1 hypothetical protein CEUSTIGMA_g869.t1 [Chlamydomonas eustigma]